MPESVPVRCPVCRRAHVCTAPSYPCACGTPTVLRLDTAAGPAVLAHRAWDEEWVTVRCAACGRGNQWPRPELGCPCGTVLRLAMSEAPGPAARDAVTATVLYLRRLGFRGIRRADQRPPSGVGLAARGLVAQVDPATRPASPRDVECLWLTAMTESAGCAYFSLAGYDEDARARADTLGVPLFVLDLTGVPAPVNAPGRALAEAGAA
ncbi:hypothetical protein [Streptomyces collinus]|uniref:hypothetical protein n=1 Tax=Streptomyces collinus TaxID=42684 RepID=UPI00294368DE|nr:hypothetical protein [Streptomyces collinus]